MSYFDDIQSSLCKISSGYTKNIEQVFQLALNHIDRFERAAQNGQFELLQSSETHKPMQNENRHDLEKIIEDDESNRTDTPPKQKTDRPLQQTQNQQISNKDSGKDNSETDNEASASSGKVARTKKRNKLEMEGKNSPEQDKRLKRNASVKAQQNISQQVNVNLTQKMRRPQDEESQVRRSRRGRGKQTLEENKENLILAQVKQEKVSLPVEDMQVDDVPLNIPVKSEPDLMPPPPLPRPRRQHKQPENKIEADILPVAAPRATRASARASSRSSSKIERTQSQEEEMPPPSQETRPKRTRARKNKKQSESDKSDSEKLSQESAVEITQKARPKRTRRGVAKGSDKDETDHQEAEFSSTTSSPVIKPSKKLKKTTKQQSLSDSAKLSTDSEASDIYKSLDTQSDTEIQGRGRRAKHPAKKYDNDDSDFEEPKKLTKKAKEAKALEEKRKKEEIDKNGMNAKQTDSGVESLPKEDEKSSDALNENAKTGAKLTKKDITRTELDTKDIENSNITKTDDEIVTKVKKGTKTRMKQNETDFEIDETAQTGTQHAKIDKNHIETDANATKEAKTTAKEAKKGTNVAKIDENEEISASKAIELSRATVVLENMNLTRIITSNGMDKTVILPNGDLNQEHGHMNETVVISKQNGHIMDETVVITKSNSGMTEDSIMTDDNSDQVDTPPKQGIPTQQPTSAVKERVQQFEELATRVTRTKTRAMAKKESTTEDQCTPPNNENTQKSTFNIATLAKITGYITGSVTNSLNSVSQSASKPNNIVNGVKTFLPNPHSARDRDNAVAATREREKEDALKKKEALLEAKREEHKRRREQKMAAAAAAREAQAKERERALQAAERERREKQAQADLTKMERLKEAERKKVAQEKKIAETEERRKCEETAKQQKLEEERRRASLARRRMQDEKERIEKEVAQAERQMKQAKQQYLEKENYRRAQAMKNQDKNTPLKYNGSGNVTTPRMHPCATPVCKAPAPLWDRDGYQYLESDDDSDAETKHPKRKLPEWNASSVRLAALKIQELLEREQRNKLFLVRRQTPDLRNLFNNIDSRALKRGSSQVWRTPPNTRLPQVAEED